MLKPVVYCLTIYMQAMWNLHTRQMINHCHANAARASRLSSSEITLKLSPLILDYDIPKRLSAQVFESDAPVAMLPRLGLRVQVDLSRVKLS
jgi:hypothetical protein